MHWSFGFTNVFALLLVGLVSKKNRFLGFDFESGTLCDAASRQNQPLLPLMNKDFRLFGDVGESCIIHEFVTH